mgnify:CR=1 FL=1
MELDIDYLRDYYRSIEILEVDVIDKNKIPDSWKDIFSENDMKNRIKKILDIWRRYVANEFKNTIAYLERNLESVDLVGYDGKISNDKGVLCFADSKPRYDIDFWSVVDEWTVIGFE